MGDAPLGFEAAQRDHAGRIDQRRALAHEVVVVGLLFVFIFNNL
jgi:hypothetical protein